MRCWCCILVVTLWLAPHVAGQEPDPPQTLRRQVNQLVRQLFDPELAKRDEAEKKLLELGDDILPLLPETSSRTPAEVLQRLGRVTSALESKAAEETVTPTTVTLSGDFDLVEVFEAIEEQTGNRFAGQEDLVGTFQMEWKDKPYWEAIDQLLDEAGLEPLLYSPTPNVMTLEPRPAQQRERSGAAFYNEVLRIEPVRMLAVRDLLNPAIRSLRATIRVSWEQRVSPISITLPVERLAIQDDQGAEIASTAQGELNAFVPGGATSVEMDLPLSLPSREAKRIGKLTGELNVMIPGRIETFQFDGDLEQARSVQLRKAGLTVILERVRKNEALYQIMLRMRYGDAADSMQSHLGLAYRNEAFLVNEAGERIEPATMEQLGTRDNEVAMAYLFAVEDDLKGYRFALRAPAMILNRSIKFELKDIDLP